MRPANVQAIAKRIALEASGWAKVVHPAADPAAITIFAVRLLDMAIRQLRDEDQNATP